MNFKNMDIAAAVACCGIVIAAGAIEMKPLGDHWEIRRDRFTDRVHLAISRRTPSSYSQTSFPIPLSELHGLTPDQVRGVQSPVRFELRREAGTFVCDGIVTLGAGAGQFRFSANPNFVAEMEKLGYWGIGDENLYSLALSDTGTSYASSMRAAGLTRVSLDELVNLRGHGVDADYVRGAKRNPKQELIPAELIRMRDHGVTMDYLTDIVRMGYTMDSDDIVKLKEHGVGIALLRDLREYQHDLSVDGIVKLRDHGVDGRFIRELYKYGLRFNVDEIVELKEHGVDSAYVERLKDAGFQDASADGIVKLRDHGVQPGLISEARKAGYDNLSTDDLVKLHNQGVNGEYIKRLYAGGLKNLTVDQMVKLREHGID